MILIRDVIQCQLHSAWNQNLLRKYERREREKEERMKGREFTSV